MGQTTNGEHAKLRRDLDGAMVQRLFLGYLKHKKRWPDVRSLSSLHPTHPNMVELRLREINFHSADVQLPEAGHYAGIRFHGEPGLFDYMVDWGPELQLQDRGVFSWVAIFACQVRIHRAPIFVSASSIAAAAAATSPAADM